jgi:signal transduction histidine kinase
MTRVDTAALLRWLLVTAGVAAVLAVVVKGGRALIMAWDQPRQLVLLLPFLAAGVAAVTLFLLWPLLERTVARVTGRSLGSPYSALAEAARRIQAGTLEQVLPGLAQVLVEGTGAVRAAVWLAVGDRLVEAVSHPPHGDGATSSGRTVPGLAELLLEPDVDSAVPVLDAGALRAALTITKPAAVTVADRELLHDVANGATLPLRVVSLNAELSERVRRASELAEELGASRRRLDSAREAARRRLLADLSHATGDRLAGLRTELAAARAGLADAPDDLAPARESLARARALLDDLLDRFRTVARGVYPSVLRDHGPAAALDEVVADLPRPVRLSAELGPRAAWELESGLYYAAASALRELAGRPADRELSLHLEECRGELSVVLDDPAPPVDPGRLEAALADDADRLVALGGGLRITGSGADGAGSRRGGPHVVVRAWVPDRVEPVVERAVEAEVTGAGVTGAEVVGAGVAVR